MHGEITLLYFFYFFSEQDILDLETGVLQNPVIK